MRDFINIIKLVEYEIDDEEETPSEREAYQRQRNVEEAVKQFCVKEIGWDMDIGYSVMFDADENTLHITPNEFEFTLEQLNKLAVMGEVHMSTATPGKLNIEIKTPEGFNITPQ